MISVRIEDDSVCLNCRNCGYEAAHISAYADDDHPEAWWCEEDMENFGMTEGCWKYEERPWRDDDD